ncbi:chorion peroxidase-like [Panulirus ornatus]|uniref:chorion peroxidase-like n=1 Tax=Panulirus ornatus TaxID=150431 RepID=UPI003A8436CD
MVEQNVFCGPELRRTKPESCDVFSPFRTPDGTCNNLNDPLLGASFSEHERLLPPDYSDGVSELRRAADGGNLPSARLVSDAANLDSIRRSSCNTVLFTNFGQLTDHDFAFTPITKGTNGSTIPCCIREVMENQNLLHPQCAPIAIPVDDPFYSAFGETCMEFVRSSPADRCNFGPREQLNEVTSFMDVSAVYGSTKSRADSLRTFTDGLLVTQLSRDGQELLGIDLEPEDGCTALETPRETLFCFKTGDVRVNEQEGLTVVSTALAREHNRLARMLGRLNPGWDDERIYQETRRIVIAKIQHITYNEFLPLALGPALVKRVGLLPQGNGKQTDDYDPTINPRVTNEFTTAAFRFGHSMLPTNLWRINTNGTTNARELSAAFFNPFPLYMEGGATRLLLGMMQSAPKVDNIFTREVSGRLFREEKQFGLDLVAINIQRGRDHGIPGYVAVRRACGFPKVTSFSQLSEFTDPQVLQVFKRIYRNVNDIDLFAGGLAEKPLPGALLGPTLSCIIADQFLRGKIGDRFWFEYKDSPGAFTTDQLREIHQVSMARVLCDNFPEIRTIQRWPFQVVTAFNPMLQCSSKCIPNFNLELWKE